MSFTDKVIHSTVRIETRRTDGKTSTGTGFMVALSPTDEDHIPVIVTAKHVIEKASVGYFNMTLAVEGAPAIGKHEMVPIQNFGEQWIAHPNGNVDLAAMPLGPVVHYLTDQGKEPYFVQLARNLIADAQCMNGFNAVEDVLMVGYPNGLWDSRNNLPITRRGITATPPSIDFEGKPEFVIDCACFPGSSGSPVFLYNQVGYVDKMTGNHVLGTGRMKLLGVLWGMHTHTAEGDVRVVPVPTADEPRAFSRIPNNLGYCVKAEQILAFESIFEAFAKPEREAIKQRNSDAA